ncbi:hypothetical protein BOTBODRAFT_466641 [Botryobasidium botryosum FD-172 SS1]|uniref:Uncharacterized protein n=1 Tax=Botryobasidium botryosum (strain FD-172 SS1) TaxID=930990 RepID=A0A067M8T2_BOTB1|nr:hypothetical protein BOTBODRAFT_466641 [Botryobasidium botryosum FD-172 SS1]
MRVTGETRVKGAAHGYVIRKQAKTDFAPTALAPRATAISFTPDLHPPDDAHSSSSSDSDRRPD